MSHEATMFVWIIVLCFAPIVLGILLGHFVFKRDLEKIRRPPN